MTRKDFTVYYSHMFGSHAPFRGRFWKKHRELLKCMDFQEFGFAFSNFDVYSLAEEKDMKNMKQERMYKDLAFFTECVSGRKIDPMDTQFATKTDCMKVRDYQARSIWLGNCEAATPPLPNKVLCDVVNHHTREHMEYVWKTPQEKGNNPMRIDTTTATAYVTAPKSDDAVSRDYLLSRLSLYEGWRSPKTAELSKLFKLGENDSPETYLQLIDAIKNDKFSLDPAAVKRLKRIQEDEDDDGYDVSDYGGYGPLYGIIFTDFPKPDRKGYDAAVQQFNGLIQTTKDTIMVKSPDEGLTALQALEAWTPTTKAS